MSKISELSDGGSLVSSDYLIAVRSGGNVKVRMDQINVDQVDLGDNEFIRLGNSQDLTMVHTSTQSIINQAGIGDLLIQKAGSTKLTINASGIDVTGSVTATAVNTGAGAAGRNAFSSGDIRVAAPNDTNISLMTVSNTLATIKTDFYGGGSLVPLVLQTGANTNQLYLDTAGNVGIGTSSPTAALDVRRLDASGLVAEFHNNIGYGIDIGTSTAEAYISSGYQQDFLFKTNAGSGQVERMRIDSSGNAIFTKSGGAYLQLKDASAVRGAINVGTSDGLVFTTGASFTERMRIDASGNVGIGAVPPSAQVSYIRNVQIEGLQAYGHTSINDWGGFFTNSYIDAAGVRKYISSSQYAHNLHFDNNGSFILYNAPNTNSAGDTVPFEERFRIDASGKVGIGGTPNYKLNVVAAAGAQNIFQAGQSGISNGLSITSDGTNLTYSFLTGSVGIGTATPDTLLHLSDVTGGAVIRLERNDSTIVSTDVYGEIQFEGQDGSAGSAAGIRGKILGVSEGNTGEMALAFQTAPGYSSSTERMRIDASGNLLVGKTAADGGVNGGEIRSNGEAYLTATSTPLSINRKSTDGALLNFAKDGVPVGSIGTTVGLLGIGSGDAILAFDGTANAMYPMSSQTGGASNGVLDFGSSLRRFKDLYLSGVAYSGGQFSAGTTGNDVFFAEGSSHIFRRGSAGSYAEFGRFDTTGNLLVGTTSPSNTPSQGIALMQNTSVGSIGIGHANGTTSGNGYMNFAYNGGAIGSVTQSGTTAVLYNTTSDQRLKENIADADDAGSKIDAIQVRKFDWKADGSRQDYGMVAQELLDVAPEAVSVPEDPEEMMGVDYSKLVPMLVKEIQSLRARVAQLES